MFWGLHLQSHLPSIPSLSFEAVLLFSSPSPQELALLQFCVSLSVKAALSHFTTEL